MIVKSTLYYAEKQGWVEYPVSTVLQMIGRAGRPQFDSSGVAVVMTQRQRQDFYNNILNGQQPVERCV